MGEVLRGPEVTGRILILGLAHDARWWANEHQIPLGQCRLVLHEHDLHHQRGAALYVLERAWQLTRYSQLLAYAGPRHHPGGHHHPMNGLRVPQLDGPTLVGQFDRSAEPVGLHVDSQYTSARLLVTDGHTPAGSVDVPLTGGTRSARYIAKAASRFPVPAAAPPLVNDPITVVIPTRGRPTSLLRCIHALLAGSNPAVTVLVVDNDPDDDHTRLAVASVGHPSVRYVREPIRGVSAARNAGLLRAETDLVAFTDDDTEPDTHWAGRIAGAFAEQPGTACVTGLVLAARLDTAERRAADEAMSWGKGFEPRSFSLAAPPAGSPIFPFAPGLFGIGANFAVRRKIALDLGGFDEALGGGTLARGGEDCDFFTRLILAGETISYVPSAWVWHHHRADAAALARQLAGYRYGLGGFLAKVALEPRACAAAMRRLPAAFAQLHHISTREHVTGGPQASVGEQLHGLFAGAYGYIRGRQEGRRRGYASPPLTARR